ncbi:hypothetical protein [Streptomyces mirabilis]|jgi:hypothetical protein|uniref:Sigma 54 modulation protein / S30EA ribosomal protein n=1 Tax=Streptomyces mirabilis TaxID=68239 RepID=A0A1I1Z5Y0_9ACTN|nr:hypothetical protein [Streptomyces mirabilis]SFE27135.1 hypothetical protein SAMN02787118_101165 [Streptomyces mirabilis]
MTSRDTGGHAPATAAVQVRAEGEVDEESVAYVRAKLTALFDRPDVGVIGGEVRITRAAAHHAEQPWSATAEIRVGSDLLVVHAREASAHELADRLQDRLRSRMERVAHRTDTARRSATPPPWRGGPSDDQQQGRAERTP